MGQAKEPAGTIAVRELEVPITGLDRAWTGFRLAHVSDLHIEKWSAIYEELQSLLVRLDYDMLAITGDFIHRPKRWQRALPLVDRLLQPISRRTDIYGVLGNHDHPDLADAGLPVTFLRNQAVALERDGRRMSLIGVEQTHLAPDRLAAALGQAKGDHPGVLLAHYPSTIHRVKGAAVGLQLSGHTHAGQVRIPGLGCIWANDRIPLAWAHGLHRLGRTVLHTSAGVGTSGPLRLRLWCPPEVSILELIPAPSSAASEKERLLAHAAPNPG